MSVNIKCPLNISNCIEFPNSKSTIKNQNFLIWSYRIFVFLFISFRWQKSDKNPTLIVAMPLTFMHSLPLNWHKNVQKDRQTGGQTVFKTEYQEDKNSSKERR